MSKWAYEEWKCEGDYCVGDCDLCYKANITQEDLEEDGFITPEEYLKNDN